MTIAVVGGALANKPGYGGEAWVRLSWVLGLRRLGIDAWLVEDLDASSCTDRRGVPTSVEDSDNLSYFKQVVETFGLAERAVLRVDQTSEVYGAGALEGLTEEADLVVNIGGHLPAARLFPRARRAFIDIDPGWTQYWHLDGEPGARLAGHDAFYTIGENIGTSRCGIPTGGIDWRPIRQPVVLDDWPVTPGPGPGRFTTVATWRNRFGPVGPEPGSTKHHQFRRIVGLPRASPSTFELALRMEAADGVDRRLLTANGWKLVDASTVARSPGDFRCYVQESGGEFSATQGVYAHSCSGWFSDRSLRYLASGRPVLVQDTGIADIYPVGEGLVTFDSLSGARAGAARIEADHPGHSEAARALAEAFFDSDVVLGRLVDELGVS